MRNPIHPPVPGSEAGRLLQKRAQAAHESLARHEQLDMLRAGTPEEISGLRRLVRESWQRSASLQANPDVAEAPLAMDRDEL